MAIRNIRTLGDDILRAKAKEITEMTPRIEELIDDMFDTMYEANGVGLAAPQVGIRKRLVVIDCGDDPIVLINPVVLETSGSQTGLERQVRLQDLIMPRLRLLMRIWKRL